MAGVWLVFLTIPAAMILGSSAEAGMKALGWAGLAAFAGIYLWIFVALRGRTQHQADRLMATSVALLFLAAALMWPAIGVGVIATMPYFGAVLLFPSPIRRAPRIIVWLMLAAAAVTLLDLSVWQRPSGWWTFVGPLIGLFCVAAARYTEHSEKEASQAQHMLALTEERSRIGRDVHDLLGHSLTVISVKSELAARLLTQDPSQARQELEDIHRLAREGLAQVRGTVAELRQSAPATTLPGALSDADSALRAAGVDLQVTGPTEGPHTDLFAWVVREGTTNVLRHAQARTCRIVLTENSVTVENDDVAPAHHDAAQHSVSGNGLSGLRQRVEEQGGRLEASAAPAQDGRPGGFRLHVRMSA
jgi:two-component system sensor histidine kinase DesK